MDKVPMTAEGLAALEKEFRYLKNEERPAISKAIGVAREHGDLKENAEYHAAKERQSFIEGRLKELEGIISCSQVIDPASLSGDRVQFGATVMLADEETDKESTYQIVGSEEADAKSGKLSVTSPLARALIGKTLGDTVEVNTPGGGKSYEIVMVEFK
ncbi:MAG: transcription elongation factor GreA [Rhodospirillales bacterium]|nr:transcription elongation factor GreA [Alphaproteobacteria bacterium]MBL6947198.1 transcription elongation factor GreA [Rhodospirillales bacterium]